MQPEIVVLLGTTAKNTLIPESVGESITKCVGKFYTKMRWPETMFFVMYHPAYILHKTDYPEQCRRVKQETWEHIQLLKQRIGD